VKIVQTTAKEMGEMYGKLFCDCFGTWEEHHVPDFVLLNVTDKDITGFMSCFQTKQHEVYVMWGGVRPEYRGIRTKQRLRQARDYLHERYTSVITSVENTNTVMLKLYLSLGYIIYGIKTSTDGHTYLELISIKE